jgi:excisionase family DNA binding protein
MAFCDGMTNWQVGSKAQRVDALSFRDGRRGQYQIEMFFGLRSGPPAAIKALLNVLNTTEAAERLGVSSRRGRALIAEGNLTAHRIGREYGIEEKDLSKVSVYRSGRPSKKAGRRSPRPQGKWVLRVGAMAHA